jgi:hypothetical protein
MSADGQVKGRRQAGAWADPQIKAERITSVRRTQVLRLLRDRHGTTLPNNATGRAALQLLLELDLDGVAAQYLAPWAIGDELDRLIKAADGNWINWSRRRDRGDPTIDPKLIPERIGDRLELTFEEYQRLGLWHLRPCDAPRHEVDKYIRDRRAKRDSDRKRRQREQARRARSVLIMGAQDLPERTTRQRRAKELALVPLADCERWTIRQLAEFARKQLSTFRELDYQSARQAVLRAVRHLEIFDIVVIENEPTVHGLKEIHVRRLMTNYEIDAISQQLLEELAAESEVTDVGA